MTKHLVILTCFWPISNRSQMHDFDVHFQNWPNCHIYRAWGKSTLPYVFITIPYTLGQKLVAWIPDFWPKMSEMCEMCHHRMDGSRFSVRHKSPYIQGTRKVDFKRWFWRFPVKTLLKPVGNARIAREWHKKKTLFRHQKWHFSDISDISDISDKLVRKSIYPCQSSVFGSEKEKVPKELHKFRHFSLYFWHADRALARERSFFVLFPVKLIIRLKSRE